MNRHVQIIDGKLMAGGGSLLEWVVRRLSGEPAEIGYYAGPAYLSGNKLNVARGVHVEEFTVDPRPTPESAQRNAGYQHGMKQKRLKWPGKRADESRDYADGWQSAVSERQQEEAKKKRWAEEDRKAAEERNNPAARRTKGVRSPRPKKTARKNPAPKRKTTTHYVTKPGRTGTLYLWDVKVSPADPGEAPYLVKMWSPDADLLFDRLTYDDMLAGDGWEIVGRVRQSLTDQGPKLNPRRKKPAARRKTGRKNPTWVEAHAADNAIYRKAVLAAAASGKPWGRVVESKAFRDAMAASTRIFPSWQQHQRVDAFHTDLENAKYGVF